MGKTNLFQTLLLKRKNNKTVWSCFLICLPIELIRPRGILSINARKFICPQQTVTVKQKTETEENLSDIVFSDTLK